MDDIIIIDYYKTHTLNSTSKNFNVSTYIVQKILKRNGVKQHTRGESIALGNLEKYGVRNISQIPDIHEKQVVGILMKKEQVSKRMSGSKLYTNGNKSIRVFPGEIPPIGYSTGIIRKPLSKQEAESKNRKAECTMLDRYGVRHYNELPEMRERLRNIATKDEMGRRAILAKKTRFKKYGNENFNNREKSALTCIKKYGVDNVSKLPEITQKIFESRKMNKTVNTSQPEETLYKELCEKYTDEGVIRQYKCDRYPFRCDFYIPSCDLFIELNAHWSHGGMPFNPTDSKCIQKLEMWKEKSSKSKAYQNAIKVWCERDVLKVETARKNGLNYVVYY